MRHGVFFLTVVLCCGFSLRAQDYESMFEDIETTSVSDSDKSGDALPRGTFDVAGNHTAVLSGPVIDDHNNLDGGLKAPRVENELTLEINKERVVLRAGLDLRLGVNPYENNTEIVKVLPLENSLTFSHDRLSVSLGYQYFSWGSADKLNPTDNLNARDYTRGPDAPKLPLFSLSSTLYPTDRFSIQGVYSPFKQRDDFPVSAASRIPSSLFSSMRFSEVTLSADGPETISQPRPQKRLIYKDVLPFTPSSFVAGGRIRLFSHVIDISGSYLYDYDNFYSPRVALDSYTFVDEETEFSGLLPDSTRRQLSAMQGWRLDSVALYRSRIHRIGLDFKKIIGLFGLWGEACYSLTEDIEKNDPGLRNPMVEWTTGLDFSYGRSDEHYVNIQHIGRYIFDYDDKIYADYPGGRPDRRFMTNEAYMRRYYQRLLTQSLARQSEGVQLGAALKSEWSFHHNTLKPSLEAIVVRPAIYEDHAVTRYADVIGKLKLDWLPEDGVTVSLGTELYYSVCREHGTDDLINYDGSQIGTYYPDSRVFLECNYSWAR